MGTVEKLYISKLNEVQGILQSAASRAGLTAHNFASVLQEVQTRTQETGLNGINNAAARVTISTTQKSFSDTQYDSIIQAAANKYSLDANIIKAVIQVESSFHKDAVSKCGAMGLMQLMPGTAKELGVTDAFNPAQNINGGASYIKKQLNRFGDIRLALAAYNTGPGRIAGLHITNPDDPMEYAKISKGVRGYVDKVMSYYKKYSA